MLLKSLTFVKNSGENCERVIDTKILIASALWEIFERNLQNMHVFRYLTMDTENGDIVYIFFLIEWSKCLWFAC